jgi:hypothetical protein
MSTASLPLLSMAEMLAQTDWEDHRHVVAAAGAAVAVAVVVAGVLD